MGEIGLQIGGYEQIASRILHSIRAEVVSWQFANRMSMISFATVCLRGMISGAEFAGTIRTALLAGAVFYCLGALMGEIARRAVEENVLTEFEKLVTSDSEPASEEPPMQ